MLADDAEGVTMEVNGAKRRFAYGDLGAGTIQVEFGRVPDAELEELSDAELAGEFYEADLGAGGDGH